LPVQGRIRSAVQWYATDTWLRARAEFRDGSVVDLVVTDRIRRREIKSVSASGKHKTKTKGKELQLVRASRSLPRTTSGRQPAVPPPEWIRVRVRDGKRRTVSASGKTLRPAMPQDRLHPILLVVTELFRWTAPVTTADGETGTPRRSM
jgi:hypothetical protein